VHYECDNREFASLTGRNCRSARPLWRWCTVIIPIRSTCTPTSASSPSCRRTHIKQVLHDHQY